MTLGQKIKKLRKKAEMSQETLGKAAEISSAHMSAIETGGRNASTKVLVAIATALGTTINGLTTGTTNEKTKTTKSPKKTNSRSVSLSPSMVQYANDHNVSLTDVFSLLDIQREMVKSNPDWLVIDTMIMEYRGE